MKAELVDVFGFDRMSAVQLRGEAAFNVNLLRTDSHIGCKSIAAPCSYCFPCRLATLIEVLAGRLPDGDPAGS